MLILPPSGRPGAVAPPGTDVAIDETNASCCIKLTGRAWVNAANDIWGGTTFTRYNRSRVIGFASNWTDSQISFEAISLYGTALAGAADPYICVVVNGALHAAVPIPVSFRPIRFNVSLPVGSKSVQLWEGWQARLSEYNTGVDGRISGCYVTTVRVPTGQPSPTKLTATRGVVTFGDSTNDANANEPYSWYGWCGQIRRALHARRGLFAYVGWGGGTMAGDGLDEAAWADCISDLWADMGCTTKQFIYGCRPNDYKYYGLGVDKSPTALATFLGNGLDLLSISDPGYTAILAAPFFPQGSAQVGANSGGFTRANYATAIAGVASGRSQVTVVDWSAAFDPATDLAEGPVNGVHPNQDGQDGVAALALAELGGLT